MSEQPENIKLKPKHKIFADAIINGKSQEDAYSVAGYTAKNSDIARSLSSRLATNENIQKYIEIQRKKLAEEVESKTIATVIKTVTELSRIGYCDPANLFDENGNLKNIKDIDIDTRKAIASIETNTEKDKENNSFTVVSKVKFWDKNKALTTIATYLGMLIERHQIDSNVTVKQQIDTSNLDDNDLILLSNTLKKVKVLQVQNEQKN